MGSLLKLSLVTQPLKCRKALTFRPKGSVQGLLPCWALQRSGGGRE